MTLTPCPLKGQIRASGGKVAQTRPPVKAFRARGGNLVPLAGTTTEGNWAAFKGVRVGSSALRSMPENTLAPLREQGVLRPL